jgi:hypothetical protein
MNNQRESLQLKTFRPSLIFVSKTMHVSSVKLSVQALGLTFKCWTRLKKSSQGQPLPGRAFWPSLLFNSKA